MLADFFLTGIYAKKPKDCESASQHQADSASSHHNNLYTPLLMRSTDSNLITKQKSICYHHVYTGHNAGGSLKHLLNEQFEINDMQLVQDNLKKGELCLCCLI